MALVHPQQPLCRIALRPPQAGGLGDGHFRLLLTNTGRADLTVQLEAADLEHGLHFSFEPPLLVVPAGQERVVPLRVRPRAPLPGVEPRVHSFTITARPPAFPDQAVQCPGEWKQLAPAFELALRPARAQGTAAGLFTVQVTNRSLEELTLELAAADPDQACTYAFQPATIVVPAGESAPAQLRVRARAPLPGGEARVHPFTVAARPRGAPQVVRRAQGEWVQSLPALALHVQPLQPRGHAEGRFHLEVRNADEVELTVGLAAGDAEGACHFTLTPPLVVVPAGQVRPAQVRVQPRAALRTAAARPRPFTITARPAEAPGWTCQAAAEWVQLPAPRPAGRTWGPLALLLLGWALAWAGGLGVIEASGTRSAWHDLLTRRGYDPALVHWITDDVLYGLLQATIVGLAGGLVTALALAWAEPSLRRRHVLAVWAGWCLGLLLGGAVLAVVMALWRSSPDPALPAAVGGAAMGLAGGAVTGVALRRAVRRVRPGVVALGWALAWGLGYYAVVNLLAANLLWLEPLFEGWLSPSYGVLLIALVSLGGVIGLGGGGVSLWEIARARRRIER